MLIVVFDGVMMVWVRGLMNRQADLPCVCIQLHMWFTCSFVHFASKDNPYLISKLIPVHAGSWPRLPTPAIVGGE